MNWWAHNSIFSTLFSSVNTRVDIYDLSIAWELVIHEKTYSHITSSEEQRTNKGLGWQNWRKELKIQTKLNLRLPEMKDLLMIWIR